MSLLDPGRLVPAPQAATPVRRAVAQARFDARIMLRNGEQVLLTLILPTLLMIGLTLSPVPDLGAGPRIEVIAPGALALAVISTAFTGQAIGTAFDRRYGVLRLLGTTPLGRSGLVLGRVLAVLVVELVQVAVLGGVGVLALGWRPSGTGVLLAVPVMVLGTATFVALGLFVAGVLRSEAVLAVANVVWVLLVAGGAVVIPPAAMGRFGELASALPSGALGNALRAALQQGQVPGVAVAVLLAWGVGAAALTVRTFSWD